MTEAITISLEHITILTYEDFQRQIDIETTQFGKGIVGAQTIPIGEGITGLLPVQNANRYLQPLESLEGDQVAKIFCDKFDEVSIDEFIAWMIKGYAKVRDCDPDEIQIITYVNEQEKHKLLSSKNESEKGKFDDLRSQIRVQIERTDSGIQYVQRQVISGRELLVPVETEKIDPEIAHRAIKQKVYESLIEHFQKKDTERIVKDADEIARARAAKVDTGITYTHPPRPISQRKKPTSQDLLPRPSQRITKAPTETPTEEDVQEPDFQAPGGLSSQTAVKLDDLAGTEQLPDETNMALVEEQTETPSGEWDLEGDWNDAESERKEVVTSEGDSMGNEPTRGRKPIIRSTPNEVGNSKPEEMKKETDAEMPALDVTQTNVPGITPETIENPEVKIAQGTQKIPQRTGSDRPTETVPQKYQELADYLEQQGEEFREEILRAVSDRLDQRESEENTFLQRQDVKIEGLPRKVIEELRNDPQFKKAMKKKGFWSHIGSLGLGVVKYTTIAGLVGVGVLQGIKYMFESKTQGSEELANYLNAPSISAEADAEDLKRFETIEAQISEQPTKEELQTIIESYLLNLNGSVLSLENQIEELTEMQRELENNTSTNAIETAQTRTQLNRALQGLTRTYQAVQEYQQRFDALEERISDVNDNIPEATDYSETLQTMQAELEEYSNNIDIIEIRMRAIFAQLQGLVQTPQQSDRTVDYSIRITIPNDLADKTQGYLNMAKAYETHLRGYSSENEGNKAYILAKLCDENGMLQESKLNDAIEELETHGIRVEPTEFSETHLPFSPNASENTTQYQYNFKVRIRQTAWENVVQRWHSRNQREGRGIIRLNLETENIEEQAYIYRALEIMDANGDGYITLSDFQ